MLQQREKARTLIKEIEDKELVLSSQKKESAADARAHVQQAEEERRVERERRLRVAEEEAKGAQKYRDMLVKLAEGWLELLPCQRKTEEAAAEFFREAALYLHEKRQV